MPEEQTDGSGPGGGFAEPLNALPETTLEALPEALRRASARAGWSALMPVQARALPYLIGGRDMMVQSRTGSGKTGAFVLSILSRVDLKRASAQALVLVPTRELAHQVAREAAMLAGDDGLRSIAVYGGTGYREQIEAFRRGAHLVIGTPGRVLDHLMRRTLTLDDLQVLVFDEADRMLSMGFYPDMCRLQRFLPRRRHNGWMFSATYPAFVLRLAGQFLHEPEMLSLSEDSVHVLSTEHAYVVVPALKKDRALIRIIEVDNPPSAFIFCNTKAKVEYVAAVLRNFGYDADALTADLNQGAREKVLARVRESKLRFLVATDLAARGIDVPDLSHVIQYEPPEDPEGYVHRAGRTGRAGATGVAITLVAGVEELSIKNIAKQFSISMVARPLPTEEEVQALVAERVTALLEARMRALDSLHTERMGRFVPLARQLGQIEEEAPLLAMLLDEYYQRSLHAPPDAPAPPPHEGRSPDHNRRPRDRGPDSRRRDRDGPRRRHR